MDFSYPLLPELYVVPAGYTWNNLLQTHQIRNHYRFMGIGQDISPVIFADGVNDAGLAAAALYFPDEAHYDPVPGRDAAKPPVAAMELVGLLLGMCASVKQAVRLLGRIQIVGVKDSVTDSAAPLHWIVADKEGACMTVEKTADGLHLMNNPIGVLSNSPDFRWHMTNLRNYLNLNPFQSREEQWSSVRLTPFGQGGGSIGLPGDYSPPARFVRAAYQKSHAVIPADHEEAVAACFHILQSVSITKGIVMTARGTSDFTQYTALLDLTSREYYFTTYDDSRIVSVRMPDARCGESITSIAALTKPVAPDSKR